MIFNENSILQSKFSLNNWILNTLKWIMMKIHFTKYLTHHCSFPHLNSLPPLHNISLPNFEHVSITHASTWYKNLCPSIPLILGPSKSRSSSPSSVHPTSPKFIKFHQSTPPSSLFRCSTWTTKGKWQSTNFHDENAFTSRFIIDTIKPSIVNETLQSPNFDKWHKAMHFEYISLIQNETWALVAHPQIDPSIIPHGFF